jgi:probable phosphomutase (TIGR03848 family)
MAVILLIRHAEADYEPGRLYGWTPGVGLSPKGREQAKALAERLEPVRLAAMYSSPLDRCLETAEAIAAGRRVEVRRIEDLGEVRYGKWQGRTFRSLARTKLWRTVQLWPSRATFPEGETIRALQHRAVNAIEDIATSHRRGVVAVISHADVIKVIAAHYLGMPLDAFQRIVIEVASVTAIALGEGFPRVLRLSEVGSFESFGGR